MTFCIASDHFPKDLRYQGSLTETMQQRHFILFDFLVLLEAIKQRTLTIKPEITTRIVLGMETMILTRSKGTMSFQQSINFISQRSIIFSLHEGWNSTIFHASAMRILIEYCISSNKQWTRIVAYRIVKTEYCTGGYKTLDLWDLSGWNVTKIILFCLTNSNVFIVILLEHFPGRRTVIAQGDVSRYPQWVIAFPLSHHQTSGGKHSG